MSRWIRPLLLLCLLGLALPAAASARPAPRYYLALGDSLSQGMQPNVAGVTLATNQGYVDQLLTTERRSIRKLRVVKLGCGGETTTSMLTGKGNKDAAFYHCKPAGGSQLAAAVKFLRAHHRKGEVPLLTLDIGANDVEGCVKLPASQLGACITNGTNAIKTNLPKILARLHKAAPRGTKFAMMTLYDPVLGSYFNSSKSSQELAAASPTLLRSINNDLITEDAQGHFLTADVADAFDTYDSTTMVSWEGKQIPINVARVCAWTWACSTPPSGPNIHANKNGYTVIAGAFAKVVGRLR